MALTVRFTPDGRVKSIKSDSVTEAVEFARGMRRFPMSGPTKPVVALNLSKPDHALLPKPAQRLLAELLRCHPDHVDGHVVAKTIGTDGRGAGPIVTSLFK